MTEPTTSELVYRLDRGGASEREKTKAQKTARAFLRKHGIARQDCPCGFAAGVHMHHPNYKKPLQVMFLCARCHSLQHTWWAEKWSDEHICDLSAMAPPPKRGTSFTDAQIKTIKASYNDDPRPETIEVLAKRFIVSEQLIRAIILVKRWRP